MGGEKPISPSPSMVTLGSPPRGRGKGGIGIYKTFTHGITPAWAGKSEFSLWVFVLCYGSPPRGRGKAYRAAGHCTRRGITPAWAGKSRSGRHHADRRGDHPRVGGEKGVLGFCFELFQGSPPRGRGKVYFDVSATAPARITPAWAGKSRNENLGRNRVRDHPRVGGEKRPPNLPKHTGEGSPPRGRGKG